MPVLFPSSVIAHPTYMCRSRSYTALMFWGELENDRVWKDIGPQGCLKMLESIAAKVSWPDMPALGSDDQPAPQQPAAEEPAQHIGQQQSFGPQNPHGAQQPTSLPFGSSHAPMGQQQWQYFGPGNHMALQPCAYPGFGWQSGALQLSSWPYGLSHAPMAPQQWQYFGPGNHLGLQPSAYPGCAWQPGAPQLPSWPFGLSHAAMGLQP